MSSTSLCLTQPGLVQPTSDRQTQIWTQPTDPSPTRSVHTSLLFGRQSESDPIEPRSDRQKKKGTTTSPQKKIKIKKNYTCSSFLLDQFKPPLKQPTPDLALEVVDLPNSRICYRQESIMCHCGIYTSHLQ